jgi:prepilin-type processing-associated H-X9-DG protein
MDRDDAVENETVPKDKGVGGMHPVIRTGGCLVIVLVLFTALISGPALIQMPFYLVMGWLFFLGENVSELSINPALILQAIATFVLFAYGLRWLWNWIAEHRKATQISLKQSFAVSTLTVVFFAAGIAVTGVLHQSAWLMKGDIFANSMGKARRVNCAGNLKQIGLALIIYAGDDVDNGFFPSGHDFRLLNDLSYLVDGQVYVCPSGEAPNTFASVSNYVYLGSGLKDTNAHPTTVILATDRPNNHTNWVNILYLDGHVKGERYPDGLPYEEWLKMKRAEIPKDPPAVVE